MTVTVDLGKFATNIANPIGITQDLASKVRENTDPFVPFRNGGLASSVTFLTQGQIVQVVYNKPYAHYVFVGKAMGGSKPKHYTGNSLNYFTGKHGQAGSDWIGRAKSANMNGWTSFVAGRLVNG